MAVDYEEGRRLLAARNEAQEKFGDTPKDTDMLIVARAEMAFDNWLHAHAEALLNPDPWRPIEEAPQGEVTEDVGCRGASEWFEGRVAPKYQHGRPPYIIVRRRAWPQEDGWECPGEATYVPGLIDAWRPLRPTHFREIKGPGQ